MEVLVEEGAEELDGGQFGDAVGGGKGLEDVVNFEGEGGGGQGFVGVGLAVAGGEGFFDGGEPLAKGLSEGAGLHGGFSA